MLLLHFLLQDWLNTRREGKKSLNDTQWNINLSSKGVIEPLYLSFQRWKCEDRIIIALIKSV